MAWILADNKWFLLGASPLTNVWKVHQGTHLVHNRWKFTASSMEPDNETTTWSGWITAILLLRRTPESWWNSTWVEVVIFAHIKMKNIPGDGFGSVWIMWGIHLFGTSLRWREKPPSFIPIKPLESWWNSTLVEVCYFAHIKMKTIPSCGMDWGQNMSGMHPTDSSLTSRKKLSLTLLLVVDFMPTSDETYSVLGLSIHENYTVNISFYTI